MSSESPSEAAPARLNDIPLFLVVRGFLLVSVLLSLVVASHWLIGKRLIDDAHLSSAWWALVWAGFASIFVGFVGGRLLPKPAARVAQWVGFGWLGAFAVLLATTIAAEGVTAVARFFTDTTSWGPARALVIAGVAVPALVSGFVLARLPKVKRVEVPVADLPAGLDGFRIVQLTDVHLGETLGRRFAEYVVDRVNALSADMVVLTGDIIDGPVGKLAHEVEPLRHLRAAHGVFYVTGNHEYYHGGSAWQAKMHSLGLTVLHNEHRLVQQNGATLAIGGVPDVEGARFSPNHRPDAHAAFAGAPSPAIKVLLAHQPRFAATAKDLGVHLMLSGHTHGGQIFPFMAFVLLQQPVIRGFHHIAGVPTYTSNGTGYWGPPFRIGARGEITEVVLRRRP
jgi:uncharacterized protein